MNKAKKILAAVIAALMMIALLPAALAEEAGFEYREAKLLGLLDKVWEKLDAVEKTALEAGADRNAVTLAVYKAALNEELVDEASYNSLTEKSFFFTVKGMACAYDYDARNYERSADPIPEDEYVIVVGGARGNSPSVQNVLLVGPYYGQDQSFTDQYKTEAASIAAVTGGQLTILQSAGATGPAIAAACINAGVVIYDSHGTQDYDSSYLCLTTKSGITTEDFQNHWAVSAGNAAYIDGRYIQHHITEPLKNCFFWMAICEGMKKNGNGTTGAALLAAGAAGVYGYSQSVSFTGDYMYEEVFWKEMKDGATVADALKVMKATHGEPDPVPGGDAWPIVMSPTDPFPINPDRHQDVTCDWRLFEIDIESFGLVETLDVYTGFSLTVNMDRVPVNANNYDVEWQSDDTDIATVEGTNRFFTVTGVSAGTVEICGIVKVGDTEFGRASCSVTVKETPTLEDFLNGEDGQLRFTYPQAKYPWIINMIDGELCATSSNKGVDKTTSSISTTIPMKAGETFSFDWKVSSEEDWDYLHFYVNGQDFAVITGETDWETVVYSAPADGNYTFTWSFVKDEYVGEGYDCGFLKNLCYNGQIITATGDADGNGTVEAADALLVLRLAMGIIDGTGIDLSAIDVDGDGEITAADALIILRKAMGILN
ncbi:MAG: Ig-like domain-containing protein [Clostridia bacterium]|nr:Ig-like domain-containing protein [Clostridia bacterium]